MFWSIDRIENNLAVCENDNRARRLIPLEQLPEKAREGDVLAESGGRYRIDHDETARRREQAAALQKKLFGPN